MAEAFTGTYNRKQQMLAAERKNVYSDSFLEFPVVCFPLFFFNVISIQQVLLVYAFEVCRSQSLATHAIPDLACHRM
jgi:hypothetical protein